MTHSPRVAASPEVRPSSPHDGVLVQDVSVWRIFAVFAWISARAWGGGSATTFIMHRELVKRGWLTSAQFFLDFGLCRIVPGINLLAMAVVVGYRLQGLAGAIMGICGLMLPASIITLILTVGFIVLTAQPVGEAAVKGAVAVTAAMTYALAVENAQAAWPEGNSLRVLVPMAVFSVAGFFAIVVFHVSAAAIIILGGVFGALFLRTSDRQFEEESAG